MHHDEVRTPLPNLIVSIADNKFFLGRRYAEWCTSAPALESAVAAAAMAQDEIGHARSLYPLLADLTGSSEWADPRGRSTFHNASCLADPFADWIEFVSANVAFDTALSVLLEAASNSINLPLQQRARRMLEEERLHWLHGEGWTRRLAQAGGAVHTRLQSSIERVLPDALAVFDVAADSLLADNVLEYGDRALRARYRARLEPVLNACQIVLPW